MAEPNPLFDAFQPARPAAPAAKSQIPDTPDVGPGAVGLPDETPTAPTTPPAANPLFDVFQPQATAPTAGEEAEVAGQAFVQGAVSGLGMVGNAVLGGQIGAIVPPPASAITIPAGIVIGGAIGAYLGWKANQTLAKHEITYSSIEEVPPELRPLAVAFEVVGGGIAFMVAPIGIAGRIAVESGGPLRQFGGKLINGLLDTAQSRTTLFAATEAGAIATSAVAEGAMELVAPGETGKRMAAGIVGGFLSPTRLVLGVGQNMFQSLRNTMARMGKAGQQTEAGRRLRDWLVSVDGDPEALIAVIANARRGVPSGVRPTAAQLTGDPHLAQFEAELGELNRTFGANARRAAEDTLEAYNKAIQTLQGTGDPAALKLAGDFRYQREVFMLETRLSLAGEKAVAAAAKITTDTSAARATLSIEAGEILDTSMRAGRTVERSLWDAIPKTVPASANGVLQRFSRIRGELLPAVFDELPRTITKTMDDLRAARRILSANARGKLPEGVTAKQFARLVKAAEKTLSSKNLLLVRSNFLNLAREAAAKGEWNNARMFGELAEATQGDLHRAFERATADGLLDLAEASAYDRARNFSRAFNDVYTRTFVGKANAASAQGGQRIPPEVLMRQALSTGEELGTLRFQEMMEAAKFLPTQAAEGAADISTKALAEAAQLTDQMFTIQSRLFALAVDSVVDPATGQLSTKAAAKFFKEKEALLDKFPEVRSRLEAAFKSQQAFDGEKKLFTQATRELESTAFARVAKVESPADAVMGALSADKPVEALTDLIQLAKSTNDPRVIKGLHRAVWQQVLRTSTRADGTVSLQALAASMSEPLRPGLASLLEVMQKQAVFSKSESELIRTFINRAKLVGDAAGTLARGETILGGGVLDIPELAIDTAFRVIGAKAGVTVAKVAGGQGNAGQSLLAASAGVRAVKQIFDKIPKLGTQNILADALAGAPIDGSDVPYSLLEVLLTEPKDIGHAIQLSRQLHAYAWQVGATIVEEQFEAPEPQPIVAPQVQRKPEPSVTPPVAPEPQPIDAPQVQRKPEPATPALTSKGGPTTTRPTGPSSKAVIP